MSKDLLLSPEERADLRRVLNAAGLGEVHERLIVLMEGDATYLAIRQLGAVLDQVHSDLGDVRKALATIEAVMEERRTVTRAEGKAEGRAEAEAEAEAEAKGRAGGGALPPGPAPKASNQDRFWDWLDKHSRMVIIAAIVLGGGFSASEIIPLIWPGLPQQIGDVVPVEQLPDALPEIDLAEESGTDVD